jgi:hypothetical protein
MFSGFATDQAVSQVVPVAGARPGSYASRLMQATIPLLVSGPSIETIGLDDCKRYAAKFSAPPC